MMKGIAYWKREREKMEHRNELLVPVFVKNQGRREIIAVDDEEKWKIKYYLCAVFEDLVANKLDRLSRYEEDEVDDRKGVKYPLETDLTKLAEYMKSPFELIVWCPYMEREDERPVETIPNPSSYLEKLDVIEKSEAEKMKSLGPLAVPIFMTYELENEKPVRILKTDGYEIPIYPERTERRIIVAGNSVIKQYLDGYNYYVKDAIRSVRYSEKVSYLRLFGIREVTDNQGQKYKLATSLSYIAKAIDELYDKLTNSSKSVS